jgi:hypothetical protein
MILIWTLLIKSYKRDDLKWNDLKWFEMKIKCYIC